MSRGQNLARHGDRLVRGGVWVGVTLIVWMVAVSGFKSLQCRRIADFLHITPQQVRPTNDHPLLYADCFSLYDNSGARSGYVTTEGPFTAQYIGFYPPHGPKVECSNHDHRALSEQGRAMVAHYEGKSVEQIDELTLEESPHWSRAVIVCKPASSGMHYEIVVNKRSERIVSIRRTHLH